MSRTRNADLLAACAWAAATVLAVASTDNFFVRAAMGVPLIFFVTGHTILRAIGLVRASLIEHAVYATGASIAACLAGGFLLHWLGHLTPLGWALWLAAVTGVATVVARIRHRDAAPLFTSLELPNLRIWHAMVLCGAVLVTWGAYAMAVRDEAGHREFKYTEFWMLSGAPAHSGTLLVGIRSAEAEPRRFDVEVRIGGEIVALWRSIAIEPGATWTRELAVPPGVAGQSRKAEARLYEPAENAIYRKVSAVVPGA